MKVSWFDCQLPCVFISYQRNTNHDFFPTMIGFIPNLLLHTTHIYLVFTIIIYPGFITHLLFVEWTNLSRLIWIWITMFINLVQKKNSLQLVTHHNWYDSRIPIIFLVVTIITWPWFITHSLWVKWDSVHGFLLTMIGIAFQTTAPYNFYILSINYYFLSFYLASFIMSEVD